ncbi:MAG: methyltransferase domain-containing protein [Phycisphaerales bacterium]
MRRSDPWDSEQYSRFKQERARPFHDLVSLVQVGTRPLRIVDLGCGTGELTRELHERLHARETLGIDRSDAMLARANSEHTDGLRFERGAIEDFDRTDDPVDLIFSNAALHWVSGHRALFGRLASSINVDGGQLAIQVPANDDHPSHAAANEVAREAPFVEALQGYERRSPVLTPEAYARLLNELGFAEQHVRLQVYAHLLPSRADVLEWTRGTLLTEIRARLEATLYTRFLDRYRELLMTRLEDEKPFLYTFKRVLIWARRRSES